MVMLQDPEEDQLIDENAPLESSADAAECRHRSMPQRKEARSDRGLGAPCKVHPEFAFPDGRGYRHRARPPAHEHLLKEYRAPRPLWACVLHQPVLLRVLSTNPVQEILLSQNPRAPGNRPQ